MILTVGLGLAAEKESHSLPVQRLTTNAAFRMKGYLMLTQARLKEVLAYNPDTGVFSWLIGQGKARVGKQAGCVQRYRTINIDGKPYKAHRLAWLYVHGVWPEHQIDHINGEKDDNRISNLRDITMHGNMQNRYGLSRTVDLPTGVYRKSANRYTASISLGTFKTVEEAHDAYMAAKRYFHFGNTR